MSHPSIPKGTRDFGPNEMAKRNYIFNTIRSTFKLFGFQPIETPTIENLSTLMGKYGEEGDKLLFRVLNSGDYFSGVDDSEIRKDNAQGISSKICEKGLRYDLTVPFARYVVQHRDQISFPFRRYQIQPVWRADRPQKGRYREFYQCDADVVGSDSLLNEAELVQIIDKVFTKLDIRVVVKINNRKLLAGIADYIGHPDKIVDITVAIDKIDKIGVDKVNEELYNKGLDHEAVSKLKPILELKGNNKEKIDIISGILINSKIGQQGVNELLILFEYLNKFNLQTQFELDLTLARGLNYYTGAIFEVKAIDYQIGSISGGGRYDNLTGVFGLSGMSGVGISFGADRIYDVLDALNKFPESTSLSSKVLFLNLGEKEEAYCLPILSKLREDGIQSEIYPDRAKFKKQMEYANKRAIPYVVIAGENEIATNSISLKNMIDGKQENISIEDFISKKASIL